MKRVQVLLLVVLALLMCCVSGRVAQAQSYVQQCAGGTSSSTSSCQLSNVTAGDMIVVGCQNVASSTARPTISDGTNTYIITPHSPTTGNVWIAYAANVKSGSPKVECQLPSGEAGIYAFEFQGVGALDTDAWATSSSGTTVDTPTLTPSAAGEALFAIAVVGGGVTVSGGGWTLCPVEAGNACEYQILNSTTATAVNMTQTGGTGWSAVEAAFKPGSSGGSMPAPPGYSNLVFDDMFPGTSLNSSKWIAEIGDTSSFPWNNNGALTPPISGGNSGGYEAEYFSPTQVAVNNGLTISATTSSAESGYTWKSGVIDTHGRFTFTHGFVQIRAKMPDMTTGMWPGFWFLEGGAEIDLIEGGFTECPDGASAADRCMASDWWGTGSSQQLFYDTGENLSAGYHIYGMQYLPGNSISMYFDGKQVANYTDSIPSGAYTIIISLAVANPSATGWRTLTSGSTPKPSLLHVSEVQVWQ